MNPPGGPVAKQSDRSSRRRTVRRLRDGLERRPWVTWGLVASMVGVHLAAGAWDHATGRADAWGVVYGDRSKEAMIAFGGRSRALVEEGQLWRLVSCGFLHAGPIHLAVNALSLLGLGALCETVFGRVETLGLFLATVVAGAVLSQLGGAPLAVGASGGAFGLMGALVAFGLRHQGDLHPVLRQMFGRRLWPWVIVNLGMGLLIPGIDNLGHLGGLLAGLLLGLGPNRIVDNRLPSPITLRVVLAASAAALAGAVIGAWRDFPGG